MFFHLIFGETTGLLLALELMLCAACVTYAGVHVAHLGDAIADRYQLSKGWIGLILLATVTSVPELISSVGAITMLRAPNLAFGNIFGSNVFNLMIICLLDVVFSHKPPLLSLVSASNLRSLAVGGGLLLVGMLAILSITTLPYGVYFLFSVVMLVGYLVGAHWLYIHEIKKDEEEEEARLSTHSARLIPMFSFWSTVIILCALWMIQVADSIAVYEFSAGAKKIILGQSFVGTILLAIVTSLPELVTCISLLKLKSYEMAVGNIFGSNICNLFFIPILDLIYKIKYGVYIFFDVNMIHVWTGGIVFILSLIVAAAMFQYSREKEKKHSVFHWPFLLMVSFYLVGSYWLFVQR